MALNTKALAKVAKTIDAIKRNTPREIRERFAQYATGQVKRNIINGVEPYGATFMPLSSFTVRKKGHSKPLYEGGKLLGGVAVKATSTGIRFVDVTFYGSYSQTGTRNQPARRFFPSQGIPANWRKEIMRLAEESVNASLG